MSLALSIEDEKKSYNATSYTKTLEHGREVLTPAPNVVEVAIQTVSPLARKRQKRTDSFLMASIDIASDYMALNIDDTISYNGLEYKIISFVQMDDLFKWEGDFNE